MVRDRPTIADVARSAGVSKGLVSLALNNRPGVAAGTRVRILAAMDELGWTPSRHARSLSMRTAFTLGLVVRRDPSVIAADPFFPHFIAGVESVLAPLGWTLSLSVVTDPAAERRAYRTFADGQRVDGVFLTDLRVEDPRIQLIAELGLPHVVIGRPGQPVTGPTVTLDDRPGVRAAVAHLAGLGHTRIAHVSGDQQMVHGSSRRVAFAAAMTEAGLDASAIVTADFSAASGATATSYLLSTNRPTAIVYASDPMAIAGLGVIGAAGLAVPDDISITGFDGVEIGAYLHPPLSTVVSDPGRWGSEAARTLLAVISEGRSDDVELPAATFLDRGSIGPPRTGPPANAQSSTNPPST